VGRERLSHPGCIQGATVGGAWVSPSFFNNIVTEPTYMLKNPLLLRLFVATLRQITQISTPSPLRWCRIGRLQDG
jgi:hypothetical protein